MQTRLFQMIEQFKAELPAFAQDSLAYLVAGDLKTFEEQLFQRCTDLYNQLATIILTTVVTSAELQQKACIIGQRKGLAELRRATVTVQLKTGYIVTLFSWYASRSKSKRQRHKRGPNGQGCHLLLEYWGCIEKATPAYYSYLCQLSILCPSFAVVLQVLKEQRIAVEYKRLQKIAYCVGEKCFAHRVPIGLAPQEQVAGQRVILSLDGGRTRLRELISPNKPSSAGAGKRAVFKTPWREPKLFVIHRLEPDGSVSKRQCPIYDAVMGSADRCLALLRAYLQQLNLAHAAEVLIIADGADWIWRRVRPMLLKLGVAAANIKEAVDYFHATEHIFDILWHVRIRDRKSKTAVFKELKTLLWQGQLEPLMMRLTELANGRKLILDKLAYFQKHAPRMQYHQLRENQLPCGSGIVESAIRRVINLRFKSPSTFWLRQNVEKLIFLRAIFLAGRWSTLINNLVQLNHKMVQQNFKLVSV
ncbi:hypothetical protein L0128_12775 [candidate division KSB1 bacterium]|nr:hypothetical protein [candidate division KSB1 bacterium]